MNRSAAALLRPADFARLLLAGGDLVPRQRARDQEADRAGLAIKRRLLERLAADDPEADAIEAVLTHAVEDWGEAAGSARAVAATILEEWHAACADPRIVAHLLTNAVRDF